MFGVVHPLEECGRGVDGVGGAGGVEDLEGVLGAGELRMQDDVLARLP